MSEIDETERFKGKCVEPGIKNHYHCPHMKEVGGGFDGERYHCEKCGDGFFLDYEEMR